MTKTKSTIAGMFVILASTFVSSAPAHAFTYKIDCHDGVDYSYHCVSQYGYTGTDPYGYSRYSSTRPDGSFPHNCTSFAAFMLSKLNAYDPNISFLGDASQWDNNAYKVQGTIVGTTPHIGDIAVWDFFGTSAGHVAFVQDLITNAQGNTTGVLIADDQYGNRRTTIQRFYKRDTLTNVLSEDWPDHFISFPKAPSGGGKGFDMLSAVKVTP